MNINVLTLYCNGWTRRRYFNESLRSYKIIKSTVTSWLKKVDKSGLSGMYKALYRILPRLIWIVLINKEEMSGGVLEESANRHIRKKMVRLYCNSGLYRQARYSNLYHRWLKSWRWLNTKQWYLWETSSPDRSVRGAEVQTRPRSEESVATLTE